MAYVRGSEWGRWDLHVHTPDSLIQHYGRGGVDPWQAFVSDLEQLPEEFRVVGINDYLFLDGYRRIQQYRQQGRLANIDLFLPVIELRLSQFGGTDGSLSRLNLHVIFSDELGVDVIQSQFINGLRCDVALLPDGQRAADWSSLVTKESLRSLGAMVKASMPEEHLRTAGSDLMEGFNNYNVSFELVLQLLGNPVFKHRYFLAVGKTEWADMKWTKQSAAYKKTLINKPHFVFTAVDTPAAFGRSRQALIDGGVNATLLDCSDSHYLSTSADRHRIGNCMTWVNAIPTFEGLRHAYHEYETRVYVGDRPPKLESTSANSTHHIDHVSVSPIEDGTTIQPRFDVELPLNPGFVAIVGNKGKGKSALTDVIGLLGDSRRSEHYSFLTTRRFRDPKANLAAKHVATLTWLSGTEATRALDETSDLAAAETVQYLPQSFLENVCNEGPGSDDLFSKELGDVIFSHVPEADRLSATSLDELVALRTEATRRRVEILRGELSTTISQVLELEQELDPRTKELLQNKLREKQAELRAHDDQRPAEVSAPEEQSDTKSELEGKIETVRARVVALEDKLRSLQDEANTKSRLLERADALRKELDNFDHQFNTFIARVGPIAKELGLEIENLVSVSIDVSALEGLRTQLAAEREVANHNLSPAEDGTPARQADEAIALLAELESELDAPQRAYQNYLTQKAVWEKRRLEIVGSATTPDTLEHYQYKLDQLSSVPGRLDDVRGRRIEQALAIHRQQLEMAAKLKEIYAPVQRFIDEHPVVRDHFSLSFEVTIVEEGLADRLFTMLDRRVDGSFAGTEEGAAHLGRLVASTDFNSSEALRAFLEEVDRDLRHDNRPGRSGKSTPVRGQLRKGATGQGIYELVFGLDYLTAEFWLSSDEKPLSQLSPGQRGTLLLLFYLLIDKSSRPIVLDQPEENLDNQTVHELLVPAIAEARRSRQVIAVTHNPNLAVVGDADQVIVAGMTSDAFEYVSGAIEDPAINERVVAILEGTWPAFKNRRDKYTPTSVLDEISE